MTTTTLNAFLQGACTLACWAIGLFFLRFWRVSRDRLFLFFLAAFWAFAVNWLGLVLVEATDETRHWFYVVRLAAFALIAVGIVDKNRRIEAK
jgi:hypothetical protein